MRMDFQPVLSNKSSVSAGRPAAILQGRFWGIQNLRAITTRD